MANDKTPILAVDDERMNLRLLQGMLKPFGLEFLSAQSGPEALAIAKSKDLALILLDVMMPGMDGFQVAEALRDDPATRHIPIIFVTAINKEQQHVFRGYELGAVDYLFKPVEAEVLCGKVRVFVELHRQRRALEDASRKLLRNVEELKASKVALEESELRYRTVADYNHDWESWIGADGRALYVSPSCERISGYPPQAFQDDPEFLHGIVAAEDRDTVRRFLGDSRAETLDFRIRNSDGEQRWLNVVRREVPGPEKGASLGWRLSMRDITARKEAELQLRHLALHDPLTGLANRTLLLDRAGLALERLKRGRGRVAGLVFLDLDRFKIINDSLGHARGDLLLVEVGRRILGCVRGMDLVARFGGDEFILLLEDLESPREAIQVAKRVRDAMRKPFLIDGHEITTSASLGLALADSDGVGAEELIRHANIAMYKAKEGGKNRFHVFNERMLEQAVAALRLENDLRRAMRRGEFHLAFQPIVSLRDGRLGGFETLLRWTHPRRGPVSPADFIPVAEETGMIIDLGQWVLDQACGVMRGWQKAGGRAGELSLAVNVSARQFAKPGLAEDVLRAVNCSGLTPESLKLEITETAIMDNPRNSVQKLHRLRQDGIRFSIDDFGTGYSSLGYLQKFPLDDLKIDLSFVRVMESSPENLEIVRTIIGLAHNLGLSVVAEGIESETQRDILADLGCEYGQGYLFSRPVPEAEAEAWVRKSGRFNGSGRPRTGSA
ncbi:EAL domain-containing protein [Desulfovibrio aminophilus]|nr:EAL domain-containing protein [Desulfovibrio aminophilus]MCM0754453.1 EAL domain-containing protein [Desulfovibrio aminophilus]